MEVQGFVLEGIPKLRCLSITEIVFGVLGVIGALGNFSRPGGRGGGNVGNLIVSVLLLAAGSLGLHAVNKARAQVLDPNTFRICGILNIILCVLTALEMFVFVVGGILLAVAAGTGLQLLEQFGMAEPGSAARAQYSKDLYGDHDAGSVITGVIIGALVFGIIICALMILLTATAAKIARRNQAIILAGPSGAVAGYPLSPPGYTQYSAVKTQEMHHA